MRDDAGYDEKCSDEKTQVRDIAEDLPQDRGCPVLFHPGVTEWQATTISGGRRARCHDDLWAANNGQPRRLGAVSRLLLICFQNHPRTGRELLRGLNPGIPFIV